MHRLHRQSFDACSKPALNLGGLLVFMDDLFEPPTRRELVWTLIVVTLVALAAQAIAATGL